MPSGSRMPYPIAHGKANTPAPAVLLARRVRGATCPKGTKRLGCREASKPSSTRRVGVISEGWAREFDDPIPLPKGRQLVTLKDAGTYITKLPKAEHATPEWQAAMESLILVAEHSGPTMMRRHEGFEPREANA
jgi:hypothetical protein